MTTKHELSDLPMLARKTNGADDETDAPEFKIGDSVQFVPTNDEEARARRWQARLDWVTATGAMPGLQRADVRRATEIAFEKLKLKHPSRTDDELRAAAYAYGMECVPPAAATDQAQ